MSNSQNRPSWDDYFLEILDTIAKRATCNRGFSGCVIVKDNRILSTGYVGAPAKIKDCYEEGHLLKKVIHEDDSISEHCLRTIHAEQNAIANAAKFGISLDGGSLYSTMFPCYTCAKLILACGIIRVVSKYQYKSSKESISLFDEANIDYQIINKENINY